MLRGHDDLVVELVPDDLVRLGLDLESAHFHQSGVVYDGDAGVGALAVSAGGQLTSVTVDDAQAFLDRKLCLELELGQQYLVDPDLVLEGYHEGVAVGVDSAAQDSLPALGLLTAADEVRTEHELVLLHAPEGDVLGAGQQAALLTGGERDAT